MAKPEVSNMCHNINWKCFIVSFRRAPSRHLLIPANICRKIVSILSTTIIICRGLSMHAFCGIMLKTDNACQLRYFIKHTKRKKIKTNMIKVRGEGCSLICLVIYRIQYNTKTTIHEVFKIVRIKSNQWSHTSSPVALVLAKSHDGSNKKKFPPLGIELENVIRSLSLCEVEKPFFVSWKQLT